MSTYTDEQITDIADACEQDYPKQGQSMVRLLARDMLRAWLAERKTARNGITNEIAFTAADQVWVGHDRNKNLPRMRRALEAVAPMLRDMQGEPVITTNDSGQCVCVSMQDADGRIQRVLWEASSEPASGEADGMLPDALVPHADEWYRLCERRFAVESITISGELAEAIVKAVGSTHPAEPAKMYGWSLEVKPGGSNGELGIWAVAPGGASIWLAAAPGADNSIEHCESGLPTCGPVEYYDVEGVPLCAKCWAEFQTEAKGDGNG